MAKQAVIAGMEELFGEYILNMSKENLKIAALRGRVKMENVQLDGDMIGSHILSTIGLQSTSFGILSCSVQSVHIIIPWNNLEKEATKMIVEGVHMVCVPLVPLTAHKRYGSGTKTDPQCTLRTRLKRLLLSRLERNYWNGGMDGEGPPLKRIQRAVDDIRKDAAQQQRRNKQQQQQQGQTTTQQSTTDTASESAASSSFAHGGGDAMENGEEWLYGDNQDIPELPRDWKKRMTEKMLRNMEATMQNVHVRVEVSEKGLDLEGRRRDNHHHHPEETAAEQSAFGENEKQHSHHHPTNLQQSPVMDKNEEDRAFCFGFTLDSMVVRTANEEWKVGSHDMTTTHNMSSARGHLGPNEYVVKNNKIGYIENMSLYWDQEPPLLLAETDLMQGCSTRRVTTKTGSGGSSSKPSKPLSLDKWQLRVAAAMEALSTQQEPGKVVRLSLGAPPPSVLFDSSDHNDNNTTDYPHVYVCHNLKAEIRVRTSDRTLPGPISCSADVVPMNWDFHLRPHQYQQYNLLRAAIQRQQRFDTMLRQRPDETPKQNPRAWWHYAIACVTARPTSRPWADVQLICRNRARYIELVQKKNKHHIAKDSVTSTPGGGYHANLSDAESAELLSLEELLPLEALQAFHLVALRRVYQARLQQQQQPRGKKEARESNKSRSSRAGGFFRGAFRKKQHRRHHSRGSSVGGSSCEEELGGGGSTVASASDDEDFFQQQRRGEQTTEGHYHNNNTAEFSAEFFQQQDGHTPQQQPQQQQQPVSLMQAMTLRLGNKVWLIDWRFHNVSVNVGMVVDNIHVASLNLKARGNMRSFGRGRRDFCFDVTQCDIWHGNQRILYVKADDDDLLTEMDYGDANQSLSSALSSNSTSQQATMATNGTTSNPYPKLPTIRSLLKESSSASATHLAQQQGPNLELASTFLELPPPGVVCRIIAGMHAGSQQGNLSISSHPATFLWTSTFLDGLARFQKSNPDLDLRNAATPLARKAHLALVSPGSKAIHLNVMAPKVWIPIASKHHHHHHHHHSSYEPSAGGTLILDAGAVRLQGQKLQGEVDMTVQFRAKDFQANFVRGRVLTSTGSNSLIMNGTQSTMTGAGSDTAVIQPFNVEIDAQTLNETTISDYLDNKKKRNYPHQQQDPHVAALQGSAASGPLRTTDIHISPISLNLVDAEVLARALGKWYARNVSRRQHDKAPDSSNSHHNHSHNNETGGVFDPQALLDRTRHVSVKVDKVEIALEGHSKRREDCDRSMASSDSVHDSSPPVRAYLVEVDVIEMSRTSRGPMAATRLMAQNASIVRLREAGASFAPLKKRRDPVDSQYRILVRGGGTTNSGNNHMQQPVLRAALLHDGKNHLDEVEVDIDSVILRVTTTTLKDCVKTVRRVAEVAQMATRAMERKVHEEGRKARQRDSLALARDANVESLVSCDLTTSVLGADRPPSPSFSLMTEMTPATIGNSNKGPTTHSSPPTSNNPKTPSDSSILFRVTLNESTLLAGRPTGAIFGSPVQRNRAHTSFAVIQLLSSALVMFQSIENPDGTGSKTLHVSIDNASSIVNTEFERVPPAQAPPMIGPTGAEFRVVYATENLGCVVSQDVSLDCEAVKICLTPNDFTIMSNISRSMIDRLREISGTSTASAAGSKQSVAATTSEGGGGRSFTSLVRFQKKGTGIATNVRVEVLAVSFVLLKAYKSYLGSPEFLDFCLSDLKGHFEGCMSALSGELSAQLSISFNTPGASDWEHAMEPVQLVLQMEQMPNELVLQLAGQNMIQLNLTGILLRELADMKFDVNQDRPTGKTYKDGAGILNPSVLSTVGLRRATEAPSVKVQNLTGFDLHVVPDSTPFAPESGFIRNGETCLVDTLSAAAENELSFSLRVASSSHHDIGERESVFDLPVRAAGQEAQMYLLRPVSQLHGGRVSPETVLTDDSATNATTGMIMNMSAEPVVEFCMHNQRLSSSLSDVYSLNKGSDLLSGSVWSPTDSDNHQEQGAQITIGKNGPESPTGRTPSSPRSPPKDIGTGPRSHWVKPYPADSPEWTDMTCSLRMALERVMLPDNNWLWANEWTVDLSGKLGECTDADGWEYQTDFESFTRNRRDYRRGDLCRRRRWTRTRMVKPPQLNDPHRLLRFVWDPSTDDQGNVCVVIRSHLQIVNLTAGSLTFFACSPSWKQDMPVGVAQSGERLDVPVTLANAIYVKIGRGGMGGIEDDVGCSEQIMILPTSPTSSSYIRTSVPLGDVSGTVLHFLVEIRSRRGIVEVIVEPILRFVNLLPCQVECQVGEMLQACDDRNPDSKPAIGKRGRPITMTETLTIECGKEGTFTAVNPWKKPHISFRVPGYRWSLWQRITNRRPEGETWRPPEDEEDWQFSPKSDSDIGDEYKSIVHFERWTKSGDPLLVIMSVECGHCPTVRLYSQFWILDKSGFGCHFAEGFEDLLGTVPDKETSRRSHLIAGDARDPPIRKDMSVQGYQWSIGVKGMSLYFSKREKLTFAIEKEGSVNEPAKSRSGAKSKWISPLDISNVMPKTIVSVDEQGGSRLFELAVSVKICPGIFSRTRLITLVPRYQIVNLLHRELVVAQDGCLDAPTLIASQTSVPFHWEKAGFPPKVRLSTPFHGDYGAQDQSGRWTNGRVRLDRVGITSMRIPTDNNLTKIPFVVETEVRLASKEQPSAVVIVVWSANEKMHSPLYSLRNTTPFTVLCRQPLQDEQAETDHPAEAESGPLIPEPCNDKGHADFHCGHTDVGPMILSFLGLDTIEEFVWIVGSGDFVCFGFDDPEKPHILEWTCVNNESLEFDEHCPKAFLEVDAMGSTSTLTVAGGKQIKCHIGAEHSTKVIEFTEVESTSGNGQILSSLRTRGQQYQEMLRTEGVLVEKQLEVIDEDEDVGFGVRLDLPGVGVSVVDNSNQTSHGREILLAEFDKLSISFSQTREGYHEFELRLMSFQVDNHVHKSIHPVLIFCPPIHENEPLLHMSAVRRLQQHSNTYVFRYAAIRMLEVDICLDRRTAETIANFIEPLTSPRETQHEEPSVWTSKLTKEMEDGSSGPRRPVPGIENTLHSANSGRIYFEQLHLHPVRLSLTFTQEWIEWDSDAESVMIVQFIRGMASIASAPLTFTSFVVSHVFEAPQALGRVILTHYASQLTKQIFAILGSLAILTAPADFITNVGTGVRDFFYEPINGAVHGPRQFIEGLEAGTQSLARGVFVGVVRGAANVTELVSANLVGLTADEEFIDERKAHQRLLTDAQSRGTATRSFGDSLYHAGASVARSFRSGALGIVEQPAMYASKHGPVGFLKGVGKALVGAVVKPVVGVGDAAALVLNELSDATSTRQILPKIPKRLRRALPSQVSEKPNCVRLIPYDERAAKAQKIVTGGESLDDVYYGHLQIPSHLIIASHQCLWAIDRRSREPWCANWEEVSHFSRVEGGVRVVVFSKTGLKSYTFHVDTKEDAAELYDLLSMHSEKMGNSSELNNTLLSTKAESLSRLQIPGVKGRQVNHIFGSCNVERHRPESTVKDEHDLVDQCFHRVKQMGSESTTFFKNLDEEAWSLITTWGHLYPSLSSKRCLVAGLINGTNLPIQIKSTKLIEGGSLCFTIPTKEFDSVQGVLHAGGCILFFGWGVAPNLNQDGNVFMNLETNAFVSNLASFKSRDSFAEAMPGYQVGFLEKSVDDSGWWAKYWLLVRRKP